MSRESDAIISRILIQKGWTTKEMLDTLSKEKEDSGESFTSMLVKRGVITEQEVLSLLSSELKLPLADLKNTAIDKSVITKVPVKFASYYKFMPIKLDDDALTLAVSNPLDIKTQDEITIHLGCKVKMVLARESDILEVMQRYYGLGAETVQKILSRGVSERPPAKAEALWEKVEDIEKLSGDASVIRLVNQIILEAYRKRATDIHIEPFRGRIKLRYRIDGVLYDAKVPSEMKNFYMPILSRVKIMSNLNIVEHRLPQDGRAIVKIQDQNLDLRISCIPSHFGESLVIRILPMRMLFSLEKLGLPAKDLKTFEELISRPYGIVFVTGPTGSGKTTTLYACLSNINKPERKIVTIEDPIEYDLEDVIQIQIAPEIGLDFAKGLRSILRHDPDVIMVGEVRDLESAEMAIRLALTGHLIFSTLHTNDASSGVTRLIDIGLEPYLVASSVRAFIAQRLVRVICPKCKEIDKTRGPEIKTGIKNELGLNQDISEIKIYKGKGCNYCNSTGFYGRTAIYEVLLIDDEISDMILNKASATQIKKTAIKKGMRTLRQAGWEKVIAGITTVEEVMSAT